MATNLKLIAEAYENCNPEESLELGDPRWVNLDANGVRGDPPCTEFLQGPIELSDERKQIARLLFSGFRGSGKSTLLKRLKQRLENERFEVLYVDAEKYLNLNMPVEPYEILLSIAGEMDINYPLKNRTKRLWQRFHKFCTQEVEVKGMEIGIPKVGSIQTELKANPDFRRELKNLLERRQKQSAVIKQTHDFIHETIAHLATIKPESKGLVVILDQLEHLRGSVSKDNVEVRESIIRLFNEYTDALMLPCHAIYTVPPWLRFTTAFANICGKFKDDALILPMCRVWDQEKNEPCLEGIDALVGMVGKRVNLTKIFGSNNPASVREMAKLSGGYPRDLLRLLRGVILRIHMGKDKLPLSEEKQSEYMEREVGELAEQYGTALFSEDIDKLAQIAETNDIPTESTSPEKLADWLENHFIICYQNHRSWYDVHPLLKEKSLRYRKLVSSSGKLNGQPFAE
ncbi:MAG: hypothetical protein C4523_04025 [Myxococcales bacterium]|nr:MAG: hypothetical protein C4523_04025 [Myxococcales bacterium]